MQNYPARVIEHCGHFELIYYSEEWEWKIGLGEGDCILKGCVQKFVFIFQISGVQENKHAKDFSSPLYPSKLLDARLPGWRIPDNAKLRQT